MKLKNEFEKFLSDVVNLNRSRIEKLETSVANVEEFINGSDWPPTIERYSAQGSWAHGTIIKPPKDAGFDADLLVFVDPIVGWTAQDYVKELRRAFNSSGTYKDKLVPGNRCVTIDYVGDFSIDAVPCVVGRPESTAQFEVCNSRDDKFEPTASEEYTAWLNERNSWTGANKLREVIRLLKYLRDIKQTFSCKSILLTTLIGERITAADAIYQDTYFPDLPTALRTIVGRLDDYLQQHPNLLDVCNPVLPEEDFTRHWDADRYRNFRDVIHRYREWVDDAYDDPDETKSLSKWQRVFDDDFGKGVAKVVEKEEQSLVVLAPLNNLNVQDAVQAVQIGGPQVLSYVPQVVPWMKPAPWPVVSNTPVVIRATAHHDRTGNRPIGPIQSGEILEKGVELRFEAVMSTGVPYTGKGHEVQWQVVNSDRDAWYEDSLRGGFYPSHSRGVRWESTKYRGIHWVEAIVIRKRDRACIGRSERFFVVIE